VAGPSSSFVSGCVPDDRNPRRCGGRELRRASPAAEEVHPPRTARTVAVLASLDAATGPGRWRLDLRCDAGTRRCRSALRATRPG